MKLTAQRLAIIGLLLYAAAWLVATYFLPTLPVNPFLGWPRG